MVVDLIIFYYLYDFCGFLVDKIILWMCVGYIWDVENSYIMRCVLLSKFEINVMFYNCE